MYDPRILLEPTIFIQGWLWPIVAAALLGGFLLARRRPDYALAAVVAALPFYQVRGTLGIPTTFLELLLGSVLLGLVSRWPRYRPIRTPYDPWLVLWVGGALLAALLGPDLREGLGLWRAFYLEPVLFFFAAVTVFRKHDPRALLWGAAGALAVLAVWTGYLLLDGRGISYDDRLLGPYQSANYLALLAVPLTLLLAFWPRRELLWLRGAAVLAGVVMVAASNSRGGQLALLAAIAVGALFLRGRWRTAVAAGVAAALVVGSLLAGPNLLRHAEDQVVSARPVLWQEAIGIIKGDPLFGNGPGQFQEVFTERVRDNPEHLLYVVPQSLNPHNLFLVTWTEWGLLTLLGLLGLLVGFARTVRARFSYWQVVPVVMLTSVLGHGLVDTTVLKNDLAIIFALILTCSLVLPRARQWRYP